MRWAEEEKDKFMLNLAYVDRLWSENVKITHRCERF